MTTTWHTWALAVLGLVVVAVPFLALDALTMTWTSVVVGLAIIGLSMWGLTVGSTEEEYTRQSHLQHSPS